MMDQDMKNHKQATTGYVILPEYSLMNSVDFMNSSKIKWIVFRASYFILKKLIKVMAFWSKAKEKLILLLPLIMSLICDIAYLDERLFMSRLIESNSLF